ncbi:MAG: iron-sulfur cluster repair di-iron protein [Bacteroidetes bacterium]|nr:MAG: iron-sulfur cluster repair di-iron protein [Bacteroidota bacterium]
MNATDLAHRTVAETVARDYRTAEIFRKYGIDFCCGGKRSIEEVCRSKGIEVERLLDELRQLQSGNPQPDHDYQSWSPTFLADYIVQVHHNYVRSKLPMLRQYSEKVARVHGEANPETRLIAAYVQELEEEMTAHMQKEEMILFPYVRHLEQTRERGKRPFPPPFGTVQNPIRVMEQEHDHAGALMRKMRELSAGFRPPDHACNTYRVLYSLLEEFEKDLHKHVHLENNILFPKAIALEEELGILE